MSQLTVSLDTVAVARTYSGIGEPELTQAAVLAELAGADGISIQMHRGRRTVSARDLYLLKGVVRTKLIVEIPPTEDVIERMIELKPAMVLFYAEGADVNGPAQTIDFGAAPVDFGDLTSRFDGIGISAGFYVDPDAEQVKGAVKAGAAAVLLNCHEYTVAATVETARQALDGIDHAAQYAARNEIAAYCGRGIGYKNITPLIELGNVDEFIVGRSICARASLVGLDRAVRDMIVLLGQSSRPSG